MPLINITMCTARKLAYFRNKRKSLYENVMEI